MSNNLPKSIQTPQDVQAARDYLHTVLSARRARQAEPDGGELTTASLQWLQQFLPKDSIAAADDGIKQFEAIVGSSPVVDIDAAIDLGEDTKSTIVAWLRTNGAANCLVRWSIQRSMVGGIRLRTSRRSYDLSIQEAMRISRETLQGLVHVWS